MFCAHHGIDNLSKSISELDVPMGRGAKLKATEITDYERFLPKKQFITSANRFSPPGIEWLYLALDDRASAIDTSKSEIRIDKGERFGFCYFEFNTEAKNHKIVDLTIAENYEYDDFNSALEAYIQEKKNELIKKALLTGKVPNKKDIAQGLGFGEVFVSWCVYTYCKLLSEEIFTPLDTDDRDLAYAPFQTMANYFLSMGYSGIIYKSTICRGGKNIVLFDKQLAHPVGNIIDEIIS